MIPADRKKRALIGSLMVAGAATLWGSFSIFFRNAERFAAEAGHELSPATESFFFFGVVFLALGPRALKKKPLRPMTRGAWSWLTFFSIADALNVLLYFAAMQHTTVAIAVLTHYLAPVIVALTAPLILREPKQVGIWSSVLIALLGLALLLEPHRPTGTTSLLGAALGAGSAVLFAGAVLSMKKLSRFLSSDQVLAWHYPGALVILYLAIPEHPWNMGWQAMSLLILCGLLPGTLGGVLFVEGIRRLSAARAGVLTLIEPLVAVVVGVLVWGEHPGPIAWVGAALLLGAAYKVATAEPIPNPESLLPQQKATGPEH